MTELENCHFVALNEKRKPHIQIQATIINRHKIRGKQNEELGNKRTRLTPLINLGFTTRRMIHHYALRAVMQKDILGTTSETLLPKKIHKT